MNEETHHLPAKVFRQISVQLPAYVSSGNTWLVAAGGIPGAQAAPTSCILPLVLFSLGISGAWIDQLTALSPYHPIFC